MSGDWKIITDEAKRLLRIGETYGTTTHEVTDPWVKEFAIALRDNNPLWFDDDYAEREGPFGYRFAPAAFFTALNPTERAEVMPHRDYFQKLQEVTGGKGSGGFAGYSEVEYYDGLIRVGDTIRCDVTVADTYEKYSSDAVLVFIVIDYTMTNQDNRKLGKATAAWIQSFPKDES